MKEIDSLVEETGTNNPFEIAEYLGVVVRYDPLGQIQGYYIKANGIQFVVINSDLPEQLRRFIWPMSLATSFYIRTQRHLL